MTDIVELRSDTHTRPTPLMRKAMSVAEVGNDGVDEDPTVKRLQDMAAERLCKEAALFVPSGTMGNLCALLTHCRGGEVVVMDRQSHIYVDEGAGFAVFGGILADAMNCDRGRYNLQELSARINAGSLTQARTALVCLENTHNRRGGVPVSLDHMADVYGLAHQRDISVHMDGARIFNAARALGVLVSELGKYVDSLQFCLSKGLGCPVGSLLVGSQEFIGRAKRIRRTLGGGMRQVGVLAAAGIVALETMVDRLAEDHQRADRLASLLGDIQGITVDEPQIRTNIVFADVIDKSNTDIVISSLKDRGINTAASGPGTIRMVVHYEITDEAIDRTAHIFSEVMSDD